MPKKTFLETIGSLNVLGETLAPRKEAKMPKQKVVKAKAAKKKKLTRL